MSEEVLDAGVSVPRAMMWSLAINGTMGLIFVFTLAFSIPSVTEALDDPSGYAFMWIFRTALSPDSAAGNILTTAVVFVLMAGNLAYTAVSARQIWSFARDEGLPCSAWLCKTGTNHAVPINATLVTLGCTVLLSLINLVSNTALNAILSLQLSAMLATYAVCLACVSTAKCFRLGRYGLPINILATLYATFACFWTFWPDHAKVRVDNMNWAPVILGGVMLIASGLYFSRVRNAYHGPVVLVNR
jgi:choline transport protein